MALTAITGTQQTAWMSLRPGVNKTIVSGLYLALPTDLADGDYMWGSRLTVVGTPTTASGNTTVSVKRSSGITGTIVIPSTVSLIIVR